MYLPRSLTLTATDDIKKHGKKERNRKKQTGKRADISKGEDIKISVKTKDTDIH